MWPRLEEQNQETPEVRSRRKELFNVIKENNKTPLSNNDNEHWTSRTERAEETDEQNQETMSFNSHDSMDVPGIPYKKYLGATVVRYIQMGQAIQVKEYKNRIWKKTYAEQSKNFRRVGASHQQAKKFGSEHAG